jgi:hypothetical protein
MKMYVGASDINIFLILGHNNFMCICDKSKYFIGYGQQDDPNLTLEDQLNDFKRIKYMKSHIEALSTAIR